jgi:hypothetical protein
MRNWPTPENLRERYTHAEKMMDTASRAKDSVGIQFYAGQLSVLGVFLEEDVLLPEKEIAVYSPLNPHHPDFKVIDLETEEESLKYAKKFAKNYRRQAKEGGIHADKEAAVVYRYVTGWDKVKG